MEEKTIKVEEFMKEHPEPYTLKELEQQIPRAKGVLQDSIVQCLEVLCSESRCFTAKIGISTYFWRFDATAGLAQQAKAGSYEIEIPQLRAAVAQLQQQIAILEQEKGTSLEQLLKMQQESRELDLHMKSLKLHLTENADDPELLAHIQRSTRELVDAANTYTENIFLVEDFARKKAGISRAEFRANFSIDEDFDFIEPPSSPCS